MRKLSRPDEPTWYEKFREMGFAELSELAKAAGARSLQGYIRQTMLYRDKRTQDRILETFATVSNNSCYACESVIFAGSNPALDHYRPKAFAGNQRKERSHPHHYWWLLFDWENFQVLCHVCNRHKGSLFPIRGKRAKLRATGAALADEKPLIINPLDDDPADHLAFGDNGWLEPLSKRGETTIDVYALNRGNLVEARRGIVSEVQVALRTTSRTMAPTTEEKAALIDDFLRDWDRGRHGLVRQILERSVRVKGARRKARRAKRAAPRRRTSTRYETLWIERITLENFCLFSDLQLAFPEPHGTSEPWLGIVGENGVGKSTFLKAITLALAKPADIEALVPDARVVFNRNTRRRRGSVEVVLSNGRSRRLIFDRNDRNLRLEGEDVRFPVIALGASRIAASAGAQHGLPSSTAIDNLFDPIRPLVDVENWLANTKNVSARNFASFGESLKFLLDLPVGHDVARRRGKIYFRRGNGWASLAQMSDGFRSVIGLVAHIMRYLARDTPVMSEAEGTVLLDEIELHLHPKWKMQIVTKLRRLFPRVRFVMTTHDPLCLRGLQENESYRFQLNEAGTNIEVNQLSIRAGMDVDDLLTGGWFELSTTLDDDTQDKIHEFSALLLQADRQRLLAAAGAGAGAEAVDENRIEELRGDLRRRLGGFAETGDQRQGLVNAARDAVPLPDDVEVSTEDLQTRIAEAFGRRERT